MTVAPQNLVMDQGHITLGVVQAWNKIIILLSKDLWSESAC